MAAVLSGLGADLRVHHLPAAFARAARGVRVLGLPAVHARLSNSPAYRAHVAQVAPRDRLFYLSHRHYLARGLTVSERAEAALAHYLHEDGAFDETYADLVYAGDGLRLWSANVGGVAYDVRLMAGNDVLYEGGLSAVLHVDGGRVCVISFSMLPAILAGTTGPGGLVPFITRKQSAADHSWQTSFNKAFNRATPAHFAFAALAGWAMAQGHRQALGIDPSRHPSAPPEADSAFVRSYRGFWDSLQGRWVAPLGAFIDLPIRMTSTEDMTAQRRVRALARRAHVEEVRVSAEATMRRHLRSPPGGVQR